MTDTAKLIDMPLEPDASGVGEALDDARQHFDAGKVSMIAITIIERDGSITYIRSKVHNHSLLVGALARQQYRLLRQSEE